MSDLVDAVVVGGGLLGTAVTLALARRNLRVILLEAQRLASGATGSGFAWVNATYKTEDEIYFQLNARGVAHYDQIAREWGAERAGIYTTGALFWTHSDDLIGQERLQQQARQLQAWNYPVALLNASELAVLEPNLMGEGRQSFAPTAPASKKHQEFSANTVLFAPNDKWVDTARLCRLLVEQAQAHKAEIRLNCPALGFTRTASNAISTVETAQGRIATHLLVLAAGTATPGLVAQVVGDKGAAKRVPLREEPGLLLETPPLPFSQNIAHMLYPPNKAGTQGLHLRPTPAGGLLLGAEDIDAALPAHPNLSDLPNAIWHNLLDRAASCLPGLPLAEMKAHSIPRICVRPVPADGLPIVGALPDVTGAYLLVTHSGITLGPLLADLLAGEICSHAESALLARYRPDRFSPFPRLILAPRSPTGSMYTIK